jgi:hypothetical protein
LPRYLLFLLANITESGTKRDVIADMQQEKQTLLEKIETIIQKESEFQSENRDIASSLKRSVEQLTQTAKTTTNNNLDISSTFGKIEQEFAGLDRYIKEYDLVVETLKKELERLSPKLDEVRAASIKSGADREVTGPRTNAFTDPNLLVAAGVTRFGVLIISIYLVQILINLYRYNTRLATFYRAQADSLVLLELDAKKVGSIQEQFLPHVDYGKMPSTIPERIADAVGGGASQMRRWRASGRTRKNSEAGSGTEKVPVEPHE